MPDWTIALFGHWKYNWVLFETEHNISVARFVDEPEWDSENKGWIVDHQFMPSSVYDLRQMTGNEKREVPGDIVAFKQSGQDWTELEKRHFLIVDFSGPETPEEMLALSEIEWDLDSYRPYEPMDHSGWYEMVYTKFNARPEPARTKSIQYLTANSGQMYDDYVALCQNRSETPLSPWRKRRFRFLLADLESKGVDVDRMLDKSEIYVPKVNLTISDSYDKLRDRYALETDGLNRIKPRTLEEMENPKTAEEIIAEIRSEK